MPTVNNRGRLFWGSALGCAPSVCAMHAASLMVFTDDVASSNYPVFNGPATL